MSQRTTYRDSEGAIHGGKHMGYKTVVGEPCPSCRCVYWDLVRNTAYCAECGKEDRQ